LLKRIEPSKSFLFTRDDERDHEQAISAVMQSVGGADLETNVGKSDEWASSYPTILDPLKDFLLNHIR